MNNAEKFKEIFKKFATEVWAFPEKDFLTWLNAEYKEPTTKNNLGVDIFDKAINQSDLEEWIMETFPGWCEGDVRLIMNHMDEMPSVTPQEPRKGYWISTETKGVRYAFWCRYKCSLCGELSDYKNFCPNCGAKMESEDKE